eukprot:1785830-Rhodomonas_salina.1
MKQIYIIPSSTSSTPGTPGHGTLRACAPTSLPVACNLKQTWLGRLRLGLELGNGSAGRARSESPSRNSSSNFNLSAWSFGYPGTRTGNQELPARAAA